MQPRVPEPVSERAFVGRDAELAAVAARVDAAVAGQSQVVWVEGAAGSGKTALLREALARLPAACQVLRSEADELAGDVPLDVLGQLAPISADSAFAAGMELLALLGAAQDAGPVAAVVEDLHWADTASCQALLTAARRLDRDKVVFLISSRPGPRADGWERFRRDPSRCLRVVLGGLSVAEVSELARRADKTLSPGHAERLYRHTGGHALYVRTLLSELTYEQLTVPDGELPAPRSLASATVAQLAALPPDARMLAAALSVVNQRSALGEVGRIAGLRQPTPALESLLTAGLVTWEPGDMHTPVQFAHPLYRAAVYDDLSPTRRQALHHAAAQVLDAGAALAHRVAAADQVDDRLADDIETAALRELERGAVALAATYLLWAWPLTSRPGQQERRLLMAMRLLLAAGQTARAAGLRERAIACQPTPLRNLVLGTLAVDQGDAAAAERWLLAVTAPEDEATGPQDHTGSPADIVPAALCALGSLYVNQHRAAEAVTLAARAISLDPVDPSQERAAWTVLALGEGMLRGPPAGLARLAERLPGAAEWVCGADTTLLITRGTLGFYAGRTMAAAADLRAAVRVAPRTSAPAQLSRAHLHLAQLLLSLGEWDDALVHARLALSLISDEQLMWIEAQAHAALATVAAGRGQWATAASQVSAAHTAAAVLGTVEAVFSARIARAALARARDEPGGVIDSLQPLTGAGDVRAIPMLSSLGWWPTLIVATIDTGAVEAAARQVDQLAEAAGDRRLDLGARILGLRARIAQARGDLDQAARLFRQALDAFGADDPMLDRALLQHAFGSLLRARGHRSAALDQLRPAHQQLAAVGAEPFRQRVAEDLARSGLRPAGRTARGSLALTEREQDVATLVAKGLTNREVAGELYVSEKAVEYHLRNVFGKLGLSSRRELRDRRLLGVSPRDQPAAASHHDRMKLILDLDQRPDGRLAGSVVLPGDPALRPFWGVMELVARVEELRETAATTNNRRSTMSQLFFTDPGFEFETRGVLGNVHYGCGDVGEVLAAVAAITDGDDPSWVAQWQTLARRVEAIAMGTQTRGHKVSARNAYLRAAVYYAAALTAIDGVEGGADLLGPTFTAHRRCFDAHVSLLDPPAEAVAIPYEGGILPGYLFVPVADGQARPTLILVNGSDGPVTAVWPGLGAPALARGYNALVFDGPGQQSMLFERQVPFRPDWEHVITPVVDFLEKRPEVDAGRLGLYGLSQGGYWVPRALAFEHRIAAAVADPGVDDVAASWHAQVHLPPEMLALLDAGEQEKFDAFMAIGMQSATPRERQVMQWRAKPYGTGDSAYALFKTVEQYRLGDLAQRIRTPIMITDPEAEQFWPGQSRRLYDALPGPKMLVPFTKAEGADMHCEPMARSLLEQRMFDWLDETLSPHG